MTNDRRLIPEADDNPTPGEEGLSEAALTAGERGMILSGRVDGAPVGPVAAACHVFAARTATLAAEHAAEVAEMDREHEKTLAIMEAASDQVEALRRQIRDREANGAEKRAVAAEAERDRLRGAVERVEAVADEAVFADFGTWPDDEQVVLGVRLSALRAALKDPR